MSAKQIPKLFVELPIAPIAAAPVAAVLTSTAQKCMTEATLYVRGFTSENSQEKDFEEWTSSHQALVSSEKHKWGSTAFGYNWQAGHKSLTYFIPWTSTSCSVLSASVLLFFPPPTLIALFIAIDIGLHISKLFHHYQLASQSSDHQSHQLAQHLRELRQRYDRLQVISLSLGCRHVLSALRELSPQDRPDVVHLCAPAVRESEFAQDLLPEGAARERTYLYYTPRDKTLYFLFRYFLGKTDGSGEPAMGEMGCPDERVARYKGFHQIDVGRFLGTTVHTAYGRNFWKFAV